MRQRQPLMVGALATLLSVAGGRGGGLGLAHEQLLAVSDDALLAQSVPAQVSFYVPTMMCAGCQYRVGGSIRQAPSILDVAFAGQDVTITYDPNLVTPEAIEAAVEAAGDIAEPLGA